jgi:hypothetical protein
MPKKPAMLGRALREARTLELQAERDAMDGVASTVNQLIALATDDRHSECCANQFCCACGSHVRTYNANERLFQQRPEAFHEDWWVACDNGACVHAYGEGLFQVSPDWIVKGT